MLDLARWAPSGDNTQPWRFEIKSADHVVIHGRDTRDHCVYDLQGHASQIAIGALMETLAVAASAQHLRAAFDRRTDAPPTHPTIDVRLSPTDDDPDPLHAFIKQRVTQRRPMRRTPLDQAQRASLEGAVPRGFSLRLLDGRDRWRMATLLYRSAWVRLTTQEAFHTHREVIDWYSRYSCDRIPDAAVGLDPLTLRIMRWAMRSWKRVVFLNRFAAGTVLPRLQLDLLPGWRCGAHFLIVADRSPRCVDDYLAAGRALQRFWLTATKLGLLCQPEMTPLIFHEYVRDGIAFTQSPRAQRRARDVSRRLGALIGQDVLDRAVFLGRIGRGRVPDARSIRKPVDYLLVDDDAQAERA